MGVEVNVVEVDVKDCGGDDEDEVEDVWFFLSSRTIELLAEYRSSPLCSATSRSGRHASFFGAFNDCFCYM